MHSIPNDRIINETVSEIREVSELEGVNLLKTNRGSYYSFQSLKVNIGELTSFIEFKFYIPNEYRVFSEKRFLLNFDESLFEYKETENAYKFPREDESKTCTPETISVYDKSKLIMFNYGDYFLIPFWGFNDSLDVVPTLGTDLFAFYYKCHIHQKSEFENYLQAGKITFNTKFGFHDRPKKIHPDIKMFVHKYIGFPKLGEDSA